jgi:hypothetical protein
MASKSTNWDAHAGVDMLSQVLADESYDDPEKTLLVALTRLDLAVVRFAMYALAANVDNERVDEYVIRFFDRIEELIDAQVE